MFLLQLLNLNGDLNGGKTKKKGKDGLREKPLGSGAINGLKGFPLGLIEKDSQDEEDEEDDLTFHF